MFDRLELYPTVDRMALGTLLLGGGQRHVSVDDLHAEVRRAGSSISPATIYGCIHALSNVGLLRASGIECGRLVYQAAEGDRSPLRIVRASIQDTANIPEDVAIEQGLPGSIVGRSPVVAKSPRPDSSDAPTGLAPSSDGNRA
ncbi:transcriptional repressor [Methylobacterium oryzae]